MNNELLVCDCLSRNHQIIFTKDDEDKLVFCQIHLSEFGFFKRLIFGLKYIFGIKSSFGHFDDFILGGSHKEKVLEIYNHLNE